jgi:hypothetical protein
MRLDLSSFLREHSEADEMHVVYKSLFAVRILEGLIYKSKFQQIFQILIIK